MTAPTNAYATGRFLFEIHGHLSPEYLITIPYYNAQSTHFLGDQGQSLQFNTHFRNLGLTFNNFYPGKHEIWVWDRLVPNFPIFAGPIVSITCNSKGQATVQCQDATWYMSKRLLLAAQSYSDTPENVASALLTYTQTRFNLGITVVIESTGTTTISAIFGNGDVPQISDLLNQLQDMGDGLDYYFRNDGPGGALPARRLHLWGGKKAPTPLPLGLIYPGGALKQYSVNLDASGIANIVIVTGDTPGFGEYDATAKITEYNNNYEEVESSIQGSTATLDQQAHTIAKGTRSAMQLASIVVKSDDFIPFLDFDLGDQYRVSINDDYVQLEQTARIVGFQITYGPNDDQTVVIWSPNTEEISP